jgi:hypothetical protein
VNVFVSPRTAAHDALAAFGARVCSAELEVCNDAKLAFRLLNPSHHVLQEVSENARYMLEGLLIQCSFRIVVLPGDGIGACGFPSTTFRF